MWAKWSGRSMVEYLANVAKDRMHKSGYRVPWHEDAMYSIVLVRFSVCLDTCRAKDGSTRARHEKIESQIAMIVRFRDAIFS